MIDDAIRLSAEALVRPFEGYHRRLPDGGCIAYPDPGSGGKPWTIGWGSTGPDIGPETRWSREAADARLNHELEGFAAAVVRMSPRLLREPDHRLAAIISFAYNCGTGAYRVSTLKKRVDAGDWAGARQEIVRWNKAAGRVLNGLTRRRQAEAAML